MACGTFKLSTASPTTPPCNRRWRTSSERSSCTGCWSVARKLVRVCVTRATGAGAMRAVEHARRGGGG
eukprot:355697-Chlamydomonas_euryale.AAC.1